jgi:hypothetical protein
MIFYVDIFLAGHGVFATNYFNQGDFSLEYQGEVLPANIGKQRLNDTKTTGSFVYFFEGENRLEKW